MNKNITVERVYAAFRKAQAESKNRPFRLPKNFDSFLKNKMSAKNRDALILCTQFFNTKWMNVDPFRYFQCGFELFKTFSYAMFFKPNVMNLYKQRDKMLKRDLNDAKKGMIESAKFIKPFMESNEIPNLSAYCRIKQNNFTLPCVHYLDNKIDKFFIVFLIRYGYWMMSDNERALMPYVSEHYRDMVYKLNETNGFVEKIKVKLDGTKGA